MKRKLCLPLMTMICAMVFHLSSSSSLFGRNDEKILTVWTSPGLNTLASDLIKTYNEANPELEVKLFTLQDEPNAGILNEAGNIGLMTKDDLQLYSGQVSWKLAIGRDIFVPVMSIDNPLREEIMKTGISPEKFRTLFTSKEKPDWGFLTNTDNKSAISCWCLNDETASRCVAEFLGTEGIIFEVKNSVTLSDIPEVIAKNPYSLGFCRLSDLTDLQAGLDKKLAVVPIDLNGDNKIDHFENIYSGLAVLERGVWIGKYPKSLYENIYIVAGAAPKFTAEQSFIAWLITEGQPILHASGYSELVNSERKSKLQALFADQKPIQPMHEKPMQAVNFMYILGLILIGILLLLIVSRLFSNKKQKTNGSGTKNFPSFSDTSLDIPGGLFFDKSHTWLYMEKDGYIKAGIDDFLQHVTGTITRVKMKNTGDKISKGETFLTLIQNGKQLEIKSPVSGVIIETNSDLTDEPGLINVSPYTMGWIYKIQTGNWMKEIKAFFMVDGYKEWAKNEFLRLKDFLSLTVKPQAPGQVQFVMQEGGELKNGVLEHFGPEVWEEFQTQFIQTTK
ncbi:MAG: hypothetical protein IH594_04365 [Bacteroidales bacterium]|nr:hypothetical protein [Bacteroidales bacterium]